MNNDTSQEDESGPDITACDTAARAPSGSRAASPYAAKPWLASYPSVVPAAIGPISDMSVGDLMVRSCAAFALRPAFTQGNRTLSYGQLEEHSRHLAAWLQHRGLSKAARVAIMLPNMLHYPIALMAALRSGYVVVNINPLYTPRELGNQLRDSGAEAIVVESANLGTLEAVLASTDVRHVLVASFEDELGAGGSAGSTLPKTGGRAGYLTFDDALLQGRDETFRQASVTGDDIAFLQYTGGTTGISKGAILLHRNILANIVQNALWAESAYVDRSRPDGLVYVCALPLYHIYALTANAFGGMQQGAHNILIPNPRDIDAFVVELRKYRVNALPGINTLFNALLANEQFRALDFSSLLLTFGGGASVHRAVADRWKELTGVVISEGYGLSETSPVVTSNRFDAKEFSGTIGLPIPSTEIAIRDDGGNDLALGEVGEICIRGPQVMAGYWNRPDETAAAMTPDGFFKSGDIGFMDTCGYVTIVDRKKDMILVSGFNVYPNEIEEVIATHPKVQEVAVVGFPDARSGEVPKAFIVAAEPGLTEEEMLSFCRTKLTSYKVPKTVQFCDGLPKSNVGKVLRRMLRESTR